MTGFARKLQRSVVSAPSGGSGGGAITHGSQITTANTGYTAYYDSGLGRNLQLSDLTVVTGTHWVSDFISPGGTLTKRHFTGDLIIDIDNVTLRGCLFDNPVSGYLNGSHASGWTLDYCTIDSSPIVADQCIQYQGYTANRCMLVMGSDGAKVNGANTTLTECYVRTAQQNPADHNDGLQNVGGSGAVTIARCNIDCRPVGATNGNVGNSALFFADGETGLHTISDNLLAGGQVVLAMYDTGTFNVQGNQFVRGSYAGSTHAMAGPGSGPQNVTWGTVRPNTFSDNGQVITL